MTYTELRERFHIRQSWLLAHHNEFDSPSEVGELITESVEQLINDIKQTNYVRLADDQTLPDNSYWPLFKQGWRKVETIGK